MNNWFLIVLILIIIGRFWVFEKRIEILEKDVVRFSQLQQHDPDKYYLETIPHIQIGEKE